MPVLLLAAALLAASSPASGPCALVASEAVAATQGARVVSQKESRSKGALVERRGCFYEMDPFPRSVSLEWIGDSTAGGARRRWNAIFHDAAEHGESREHEEETERPKTPPAAVAGVGDEAFWLANPASGALYVLAGDSFLRVSVGGPGSSDEKRDRARAIASRAVESIRAAKRTKEKARPSPPAQRKRAGAI
jgi:hypothetical protein